MSYGDELTRKAIHLSSAVAPLIYWLTNREFALALGIPIMLLLVGLDLLRLRHAGFRTRYDRWLGPLMRGDERNRLCGASYVMIAVVVCILLYPPPVAIAAMLFLSVSDALASLVGIAVGGPRWLGKSVAGSAAFFASALAIALLCLPGRPAIAAVGAAVATIIEALPHGLGPVRLDDNLTVPVISGGMMALLG